MMQGKRIAMVVALAVIAALVGLPMAAQPPAPQSQQQPSQQQSIPDAPKPQALPSLTPLTQVGPALPDAPTPTPTTTENGGVVPGATLPSTPTPTTEAQQETQEESEQGPPPDMHHPSDIQIYSTFVQVPFTVKDSRGHLMPGLTSRDVRVFENGVRQQMRLWTVDPYPLSVSVVIDQSLPFDVMTKVNNSLSSLQGAFSKYDEVAIFTYNNGVKKQTEFTAAQSARLGAVLENSKGNGREFAPMLGGPLSQNITKNGYNLDPNTAPDRGRSVGSTSFETPEQESHTLLDAILAAAQETTHVPKERRRIVYVISDGKEWGSKAKEKEVIKYLQTNHVEVYATLVGDSAVPGLGFLDRIHLPLMMRDDILPRIVSASGGETDPEFRQGGIEKSFARITEEVRTQYTIGFYTKLSPMNESFRRLEVRVLRPGLTIIAPDGYYPNANDSGRPAPVTPATAAKTPAPAPAAH